MFVSPMVFIQQKNCLCNSQEVESAYRNADSRVSSPTPGCFTTWLEHFPFMDLQFIQKAIEA